MPTKTSNQSGNWGDTSTWVGGALPADGDDVVIAAGHSVKMNVDLSAMTGLLSVTIQGSDGTPGTLYWMDGASGYLKLRLNYNIVGTSGTNKGRILINSDGVWANTGALAFATKATILCSQINCTYLDVRVFCAQPAFEKVLAYQTKYTVTVSGNTFTGATLTNGTTISFRASGTLPSPLQPDVAYKVLDASGNTFKVGFPYAHQVAAFVGALELNLADAGTGTFEVYVPITTATTYNILDVDLTTDSHWSSTEPSQIVIQSIIGNRSVRSITSITGITSTSITVGTSVANDPIVVIYLLTRNVSLRQYVSGSTYHFFLALTNGTVQADVRQVSSTGLYSSPSFQATAFKNVTGTAIKGHIAFFNTAIELGGTCPEIEANSIANNIFVVPMNAVPVQNGIDISGDIIYASQSFKGLIKPNFTGSAFAVTYLFTQCIDINHNGSYKNLYAYASACIDSIFTGSIHGLTYLSSAGVNNIFDLDITNAGYISTSNHSNCYFSGSVDGLHSLVYASNIDPNDFTVSAEINNANLGYHICSGIVKAKDLGLTFPLRYLPLYNSNITNIDLISHGELILENVNSTNDNDGLHTAVGKISRVTASQYAYVPSTSYDGINDFLMVDALESQLNRSHRLNIIKSMRVWCEAGSRTITIPLVSTFTGLSSGDLELQVLYLASTGMTRVVGTSVPTTASDWTQSIAATFTLARAGFVIVSLKLTKYESGARLFVYPWPVVT